jgi:hypothetical protein
MVSHGVLPLFFFTIDASLLPSLFQNIDTCMHRCYRQDVKQNLIESDTAMIKVNKILFLLVESGVIYCIIWVRKFVLITHQVLTYADSTVFIKSFPPWTDRIHYCPTIGYSNGCALCAPSRANFTYIAGRIWHITMSSGEKLVNTLETSNRCF